MQQAPMKTIVPILLLSCCACGQDNAAIARAEAACGPLNVKFDVKADASQHLTPAPENGKALIYVVGEEWGGAFGVDGKWAGAISAGTYFFLPIDPGEHHLCARSQGLFVRPVFLRSWIRPRLQK